MPCSACLPLARAPGSLWAEEPGWPWVGGLMSPELGHSRFWALDRRDLLRLCSREFPVRAQGVRSLRRPAAWRSPESLYGQPEGPHLLSFSSPAGHSGCGTERPAPAGSGWALPANPRTAPAAAEVPRCRGPWKPDRAQHIGPAPSVCGRVYLCAGVCVCVQACVCAHACVWCHLRQTGLQFCLERSAWYAF